MRSKNIIWKKPVSWKTKFGVALCSVLFIVISAILIISDSGYDERLLLFFTIVIAYLTIYSAITSDISWKMKLGMVLCSILLIGVPEILIYVYQNYSAIWMMPSMIVCLTVFYAGVASGVTPIRRVTRMMFGGSYNPWGTGIGTLADLPGPHEDLPPIVASVDMPLGYDYTRGTAFAWHFDDYRPSDSTTPYGM
jgi:hypothetical protein